MRRGCAMQYRLLCVSVMLFAAHAPPCRDGNTSLKAAIDRTEATRRGRIPT